MKVGGYHLGRMYVVTIALLLALAAFGAYGLGTFPFALVVAVVSCVLIDFILVKIKKHRFRFPLSAIITGLIIGSIAPIGGSLALVVVAALIAEITKFFVKVKARNLFNPATVGLLLALLIFGVGDEWWASSTIHVYGLLIPLALVLIISAYEARRLPAALVAIVVMSVGFMAISGAVFSSGALLTALLTINYYFIFLMVTDPKTSPNKVSGQIIYGMGVALFALLFIRVHLPYQLLIALVLVNVIYAAFRVMHAERPTSTIGTAAITS